MLDRFFRRVAQSDDLVSRNIRRVAQRVVFEEQGLANDPERNGEYWLLNKLASDLPVTVFDVGANRGDWSLAVLKRFPKAEIHAFEIVPETHAKLAQALNGSAVANCFGLGAKEGTIAVNVTPGNSLVASTVDLGAIRQPGQVIEAPVRRIDTYCRDRGIAHLSFLKIDVEGAEHHVMDGLGDIRPDLIQWEMGQANALTRVLLADYYDRLPGYAIGKLTREGVAFKPYHPSLEGFGLSNWIAVRRQTLWEKVLS